MKRIRSLVFWFTFLLYLEMVLKIALFAKAIDFNVIFMMLLLIPLAIILHVITTLFVDKVNKVISYIFVISTTIIFVAQLIYYKTYLSIFSVYSVGEAGQLLDFTSTIIKIMLRNSLTIFFMLIPLIIFIFFNIYFMDYRRRSIKRNLVLMLAFFVIQAVVDLSLFISGNGMYSAKQLYYDVHSPTLSVTKLGLLTTMRLDFKRLIFGFEEKSQLVGNNDSKGNNAVIKKKEYNVMTINFDDLINKDTDQIFKNMDTYFKNATPTNKNQYTGMFKGKNLIMFLGESFNSLAIDKDLTPTLYKLSREGFYFTNFYNPVFPVSTSDGEYIMNTSLIPKEGVWSAYRSSNNYYPFVVGNAFNKLGYKTNAYHDHTATYYHRDMYVPNWGYDYYACKRGLDINCHIWPESDLEMINASYDDYINNTPFATYYVTVSGHLQYNTYNSMAVKNWDAVKNLKYSTSVKAYLACNIELDKALARLIELLDEKGILGDTVISLGGDHYPYGLTLDEINEKSDPKRDDNFDKHKSAYILWNSEMKPVTIDKLGSSLDILPTILNLFGVEYDSRLLMGHDLLSDTDPIVIFSNRSFITNKGRYNSITREFYSNDGKKLTNDQAYVTGINETIYNRFYISRLMLEKDYYRHVFKK